jgi:hypothetical protein
MIDDATLIRDFPACLERDHEAGRAVSDALIKAALRQITRDERDRILTILGVNASQCAPAYEESPRFENA